tara:strand:- start:991 stop:1230 length:240 start_codon:yes stop_codon:yes gene_type:complete
MKEYSLAKKAASLTGSVAKHIANGLVLADNETQNKRMLLCTFCEHLKGQACAICGCKVIGKGNMVKTKWPEERCPDGRW